MYNTDEINIHKSVNVGENRWQQTSRLWQETDLFASFAVPLGLFHLYFPIKHIKCSFILYLCHFSIRKLWFISFHSAFFYVCWINEWNKLLLEGKSSMYAAFQMYRPDYDPVSQTLHTVHICWNEFALWKLSKTTCLLLELVMPDLHTKGRSNLFV